MASSSNICTSCLRAMRQFSRPSALLPTSCNPIQRIPKHLKRPLSTTKQPPSETPKPQHPQTATKPPPAVRDTPDAFTNLASQLRSSSALRSTTEPYIAYGATEDLFQTCSSQCSYTIPSALSTPPAPPPMNAAGDHLGVGTGWWLTSKSKSGLGLEPTFNSWAQVLLLHMWLLTVRFRTFPAQYVQSWHQNLSDHFFYAAEDRMATWHGMSARGVRQKNLKDLWLQWRGVQLGYDEGLIKGDAVFAAAVWRNLFKADPEVDVGDVALVVAYALRELRHLASMDDLEVTEGRVKFGDPRTAQQSLLKSSVSMRERFTDTGLAAGVKDEKK